jgi:hypothetical protein
MLLSLQLAVSVGTTIFKKNERETYLTLTGYTAYLWNIFVR